MAVKATATENRNGGAARPRVEDESSGWFQSLLYLGAIIVPLASQVVFLAANKISHPAWWFVLAIVLFTIVLQIVRGYIWGCHTYKWVWILECCCKLDTFEYWVDCTFYALVIAGRALGITQLSTKIPEPACPTTSPWKKKLGIAMAEVAQVLNIWGQGKAINKMGGMKDHTPSVITLTFLVAIAVILMLTWVKWVLTFTYIIIGLLSQVVFLSMKGTSHPSFGWVLAFVISAPCLQLCRVYIYVARYKPEWRRCQEASELEDFHLWVLLCTGLVSAGCAIIGIQEH